VDDRILCSIGGKLLALTPNKIEERKQIEMSEWATRVMIREQRIRLWRDSLYERAMGDTRTYTDMEEEWRDLLDEPEDD
jgi:hypothetical protein